MKATGIIRRIDDLGRVVIPKELRRTLNIQVGDPLEIFTDNDTIIFKKYSPIDSMRQNALTYAKAVYDVLNRTVVVCDKDFVVTAYGPDEREIMGRRVSRELELDEKLIFAGNENKGIMPFEGIDKYILAGAPIKSGTGDHCGYFMLLTDNATDQATEAEKSSATVGAEFLGKQISI